MIEGKQPTCEVLVESLAFGGDGVARIAGKTAFIPLAAPGDRLRVALREQRRSFVRAEIVEVSAAAACRCLPPCGHFGRCGGCQWQHVRYEEQLESKRRILAHALRALPLRHLRVLPCPQQLGYRRRLRAHWQAERGRFLLGFARAGSRELVDVPRCLLADEATQRAWEVLRTERLAGVRGVGTVSVLSGHQGDVHVSIRVARGALGGDPSRLLAGNIVGVAARDARGKVRRFGQRDLLLDERGLRASAEGFAQATAIQDAMLRQQVTEALPDRCDHLLELHAGQGNLTRAVAQRARCVTAVESSADAVRLLRRNVELLPVPVRVIQGDAAQWVRSDEAERPYDVVLIDPPRQGAAELVEPLLRLAPATIVYVSCDPMTLARDLTGLCAGGYGAVDVIGIDMMPQTFHIEAVVSLRRDAGDLKVADRQGMNESC